jgi:hypothetical protein
MTSFRYRWDNRRIRSVDGEAKDRDCILSGDLIADVYKLRERRHAYIMLASADDRGYRSVIIHDGSQRAGTGQIPFVPNDVAPNYGLPTRQCLDYLLSLPEHPSDLIVAFAFTYDTTKILQDLPLKNLLDLANANKTVWQGYQIDLLPRKFLRIKRGTRSVIINDVFSFWQMSFVKALSASINLFTDDQKVMIDCRFYFNGKKWDINTEIDHSCAGTDQPCIAYMKEHRNEFDNWSEDKILEYCYTECEFLSILMRDFVHHMAMPPLELAVNPISIGGPGGLAKEFFNKIKIMRHLPKVSRGFAAPGLPIWVALASYYGGRFETLFMGNMGDGHEYDLHSAYPARAWKLPCLRCGYFTRTKEFVPDAMGFYLVGSRTDGPVAPFPFRTNNEKRMQWAESHGFDTHTREGRKHVPDWFGHASNGTIAYPHGGMRWVTSFEVDIARKYYGADAIPVYDGYVFHKRCNHEPFKILNTLYLLRKEGEPSEGLSKIIKLLLNSIYGVLAQTIGRAQFRCHIYAAWITGGTRSQILEAALIAGRKPDCPDCGPRACANHSEIMTMATDGILVKNQMKSTPEFPITDHDLGTWEEKSKTDIWIGLPGIYGFGRSDTNETGYKRRGLARKLFPLSHLRSEWDRGETLIHPIGNEEDRKAFMPFKLAVQRINSLDELGEWTTMPKDVNLESIKHKRIIRDSDTDDGLLPWLGEKDYPENKKYVHLDTIRIPDDLMSEPYARGPEDIKPHAALPDMDMPMWEQSDLISSELDAGAGEI